MTITRAEVEALLASHGADEARWPGELRAAALAMIAADPGLRAQRDAAAHLDTMLGDWARETAGDLAAADRIVDTATARLAGQVGRERPVARWLLGAGAVAAAAAGVLLLRPAAAPQAPEAMAPAAQVAEAVSEQPSSFDLLFTPTAEEERYS